jgi:hypothetical protein
MNVEKKRDNFDEINCDINFETLFVQCQERFLIETFFSQTQFELFENFLTILERDNDPHTLHTLKTLNRIDRITDDCLELMVNPETTRTTSEQYLNSINEMISEHNATRNTYGGIADKMVKMGRWWWWLWWNSYVLCWYLYYLTLTIWYRSTHVGGGWSTLVLLIFIVTVLAVIWYQSNGSECSIDRNRRKTNNILLLVVCFIVFAINHGHWMMIVCIEAAALTLAHNRYVLGCLLSYLIERCPRVPSVIGWVTRLILGQMMLGNQTFYTLQHEQAFQEFVHVYFEAFWEGGFSVQLICHHLIDGLFHLMGKVDWIHLSTVVSSNFIAMLYGCMSWSKALFEAVVDIRDKGFDYFLPVLRAAPAQPLHSFLQTEYQTQLLNWQTEKLQHERYVEIIRSFGWFQKIVFVFNELIFRFNIFRKQDWICNLFLNSLLDESNFNIQNLTQIFCFCFISYQYWLQPAVSFICTAISAGLRVIRTNSGEQPVNHTFVRLRTKIQMLRKMSELSQTSTRVKATSEVADKSPCSFAPSLYKYRATNAEWECSKR